MSEDDLEQRSVNDYEKTIRRLIGFLGKQCRPEHLAPMDFASLKDRLAEPVERKTAIRGGVKGPSVERRSPTTVAGDIRRIRVFLTWCSDGELIAHPPRCKEFSPASQKAIRRQRAQQG